MATHWPLQITILYSTNRLYQLKCLMYRKVPKVFEKLLNNACYRHRGFGVKCGVLLRLLCETYSIFHFQKTHLCILL